MVSVRENILLSILCYCNFGEEEYGRTIKEVFDDPEKELITTGTFTISLPQNREFFLDYYKEVLDKWRIIYVDNRTSQSEHEIKSGYYACAFQKGDEVVLAFRGSEKFPLEDAYKDFIETDLAIGFGKIPLQFYEGVETYYHLVKKLKIPLNSIILTGHSLGGGIAQYVVLNSDRDLNYIPQTYTWNAVGINRSGIVSVLDYIDLDKIMKEDLKMPLSERKIFKSFKEPYLEFLSKELKKMKVIKDERKILVDRYDTVYFDIDENFIKQLIKSTNIETCLMKLPLKRRRELLMKQNFFDKIFQLDNMGELLEKGQKFIDRVRDNKNYEKKVLNYGHAQDLTFSLFRHVGSAYSIDENFSKLKKKKSSFFENFRIFTKSIQYHHFEDVFFPFVANEGELNGSFSKDLNLDFIASSIRKLFTMEYNLEKRLLAHYFSLEEIRKDNFLEIREDILAGLNTSGMNLLYKGQIVERISRMKIEEFSILWEKIKKKLASPYKNLDIFDVFVFNGQ